MKKANYYSCRGAYRRLLRLLRSIYATNSILPPPREQVIKRYVDKHAQRVKFADNRKKYLRHEQHK